MLKSIEILIFIKLNKFVFDRQWWWVYGVCSQLKYCIFACEITNEQRGLSQLKYRRFKFNCYICFVHRFYSGQCIKVITTILYCKYCTIWFILQKRLDWVSDIALMDIQRQQICFVTEIGKAMCRAYCFEFWKRFSFAILYGDHVNIKIWNVQHIECVCTFVKIMVTIL